jgi:amidophosphoribosyltransferase
VTYGVIRRGIDNLVVIDDSIVRGTTLRESIIRILDRLEPAKIVIVSSSPQIRYPDCYGIDMARMGDFIAFKAAIELLKKREREDIIREVYASAQKELQKPDNEMRNFVKGIYSQFTDDEISGQIAVMLRAPGIKAKVEIVYQTVEGLHQACPGHTGDWYFTGNYPTPGGNRVVNRAFVNYMEGITARAY